MNTPETDTQTEGGRAASSLATCSEVSTHWILEGQRKRNPAIWDAIGGGNFDSETEAREEEKGYRDYMESGDSGWMDFRVVQVTSTREILPNVRDEQRPRTESLNMNEPISMDERQMSALEKELQEQRAPSASAPAETACQPRSLALASCSADGFLQLLAGVVEAERLVVAGLKPEMPCRKMHENRHRAFREALSMATAYFKPNDIA